MHLETIQHLRSLADRHDDLVPIAKPLLLDLLDSYERQQDTQTLVSELQIKCEANARTLAATMQSHGMVLYDGPDGRRVITAAHAQTLSELAQLREAGTPACPINASMTHHAAVHGLPHWQCVSHKSNAWWRRVDGYEETYFDATTGYPDVLRRIDELVPMADPDTQPDPQDLRRLRYQPHWSVREMDAIDELSRLKDLEPVAIVRQALRHYQLAHADLKHPAAMPADVLTANEEIIAQLEASLGTIAEAAHMIIGAYDPRFFRAGAWAQAALQACQEQFPCKAVNEVTPVNPVTSPQPPTPEPETFEAHGHTWTRHTPGDPCPVPKDTEVIVLLRRELHQIPGCSEVRKAGEYAWCRIGDGRHSAEIIGWRYAEPQPSTPAK